jgi:hypothetical protein
MSLIVFSAARKTAVIGFITMGFLLAPSVVLADECSQADRTSNECPSITSDISDGGVTVGATVTTPGQPGSSQSGTTQPGGNQQGAGPVSPPSPGSTPPWTPPPPRNPVLGSGQCDIVMAGSCRGSSPAKNPPPVDGAVPVTTDPSVVAPTPPSTVSDLASFTPSAPGVIVQPGSWSLPRLPTNIYSTASTETATGELLGWPIEVRFTPRAYSWSYGDGSRSTFSLPGGSWGAEQFSATATHHVYRAPGRYSISVQVEYSVSYRFAGGDFVPVSGAVTRSSGVTLLTVLRVTPVLVDEGCPSGSLVQGRC